MVADNIDQDELTSGDVRQLRDSLNMDQASMARFMGFSRQQLSEIECGHTKPSRRVRLVFALLTRECNQRGNLRDWPTVY